MERGNRARQWDAINDGEDLEMAWHADDTSCAVLCDCDTGSSSGFRPMPRLAQFHNRKAAVMENCVAQKPRGLLACRLQSQQLVVTRNREATNVGAAQERPVEGGGPVPWRPQCRTESGSNALPCADVFRCVGRCATPNLTAPDINSRIPVISNRS